MSKKFKSKASSARAASTLPGSFGSGLTFQTSVSSLSYVTESPDLSQVSEPNVVVAFKNLGKKDSTTKAKALEELQEHCSGQVELAILQAWAETYPRTSIDNSRRVRQLAHTLQGSLTSSAGRRIAPLLPKVVGPWLAGTFDNDKSVSRSAQEAIEKSFITPEKRKTLWSIYADSLFAYVEDAVVVQTATTLSDERTTNEDDAQAKYVRVVGTAVNLLAQMLRNDISNDAIAVLLSGKKLWELVHHDDPYLRRSACDLAVVVSNKYPGQLDWSKMSTEFLGKGLNSSQVGSSRQYTSALLILTQQRPQMWTTDYTAKTAISKRLVQFLKRGSQSGPEATWSNIAMLIRILPHEVWRAENELESAQKIADALRTGITLPTERANAAAAWAVCVETCLWLCAQLSSNQDEFLIQEMAPVVRQYVTKKEGQQWTVTARSVSVCRSILTGIIKLKRLSTFEAIWSDVTTSTINEMRLSQPETSKDFRTSQDAVVEQAKRLFVLKAEVKKVLEHSEATIYFEKADNEMLDAAIQLLLNRNGKPYSAASIIEMVVVQSGFDKDNAVLQTFLKGDLSQLLLSPSAEKLASIASTCGHVRVIESLYKHRSPNADNALCYVLKQIDPEDLSQESKEWIASVGFNDSSDRRIVHAIMHNSKLKSLQALFCERLQLATTVDGSADSLQGALSLIEELLNDSNSGALITSEEYRSLLLSNLLVIGDSTNEESERANLVVSKLNNRAGSGTGSASIIQRQLDGHGTPLSIFTLIDLANDVAQVDGSSLGSIVPTREMWEKALLPHTFSSRPYSLSVTSPLQGLIYAINSVPVPEGYQVIRDQDDFSHAFRLVIYVTKLLTSELASRFENEHLQQQFACYPLALQLVNEKLTVENANEIWVHSTPEVLQEAADVLSEGNKLVLSWLRIDNFLTHWIKLAHNLEANDLASYITALAWTNIITQYVDQHGPSRLLLEYDNELKTIHRPEYIVQGVALLTTLRDYVSSTAYGKRTLNELVASVTELKSSDITPLVLLNILLHGNSDSLEMIPTQRVVFLLKSLIRIIDDTDTSALLPEAMRLLTFVVPYTRDIYGEHWQQICERLMNLWSGEIDLATMNFSIRLYAKLKLLLETEDANEDLQDAWTSTEQAMENGLLNCLKQLGQNTQYIDQPRAITAEMIKRLLRDITLTDVDDVVPLLSSSVDAVQTTAYEILHRVIPGRQEQLSIDLVLEKQPIRLPEELLSLLDDADYNSRRYLLVWKLVFDHYTNASYKLREAYTANIKEANHCNALLDFVCQVLRITDSKPVDASLVNVADFKIDEAESPAKEMQWLVIHNYYNVLLWIPNLAKDWFMSQKNRVKSPLEVWTQKYVSPIIVAASLSTVTDWAETQSQEDDRPLTLKSSPRGSELTATITIDPESPPISLAISLPASYPLESPIVTSRTRVGVSEKNWQSWLRTIQIIIFSTGSIIEGLIAFRRNVQGALKGQTECAICYSIIGTDMQTPTKKCGTCKNMFHGTCLFRWFKSSNSSSCPLCRNNFNYA